MFSWLQNYEAMRARTYYFDIVPRLLKVDLRGFTENIVRKRRLLTFESCSFSVSYFSLVLFQMRDLHGASFSFFPTFIRKSFVTNLTQVQDFIKGNIISNDSFILLVSLAA